MKRDEIKKRLPNEDVRDIEEMIKFAQEHGYTPVWSWSLDGGWELDFVLDENSEEKNNV